MMNAGKLPPLSNQSRSSVAKSVEDQDRQGASASSELSRGKTSPGETELERFQRLLGNDGDAIPHSDQNPGQNQTADQGLSTQPAAALPPGPAGGASSAIRPLGHELADLVSTLVEKMWVKGSDQPHQQEIRLNLKGDLLADTQLKIARTDGLLRVEFMTTAAMSFHQLAMGRSQLTGLLQRRHGADNVAVKMYLLGDKRKAGETENSEDFDDSDDSHLNFTVGGS